MIKSTMLVPKVTLTFGLILSCGCWMIYTATAAEKKPNKQSQSKSVTPPTSGQKSESKNENKSEIKSEIKSEKVNVDNIKEKYWARGDESEMGVVQNRLYSKEKKFVLGVYGGILATDPFLSVKNYGLKVGFNFSEYFGAHILYWRDSVSPSSALQTFEETLKATTNYNAPSSFFGAEVNGSFLYGKLSVIGKAIIYYDLHLTAGIGSTSTESGKYLTPYLGIGQQVYLSKWFSLRMDYRIMTYREVILERVVPTKIGTSYPPRTNWVNSIELGFDFLFGIFK